MGLVHMYRKQEQKLFGIRMTDEIENRPAHLFGDSRFNLDSYCMIDRAINSRRSTCTIIDCDGPTPMSEDYPGSLS